MNFNDREIALNKQLHELLKAQGELPQIQRGDWYIDPRHSMAPFGPFLCTGKMIPDLRNIFILLWPWPRCREWLRERGWDIVGHTGFLDGSANLASSPSRGKWKTIFRHGQTDLEAILAVMVQVVEEEKHESD